MSGSIVASGSSEQRASGYAATLRDRLSLPPRSAAGADRSVGPITIIHAGNRLADCRSQANLAATSYWIFGYPCHSTDPFRGRDPRPSWRRHKPGVRMDDAPSTDPNLRRLIAIVPNASETAASPPKCSSMVRRPIQLPKPVMARFRVCRLPHTLLG
jgi:hypothetical protein